MWIDKLSAAAVRDVVVSDPVPCHEVPPNGCPLYVYVEFPIN